MLKEKKSFLGTAKEHPITVNLRYLPNFILLIIMMGIGWEKATKKVLYLTFDAGYENGNIQKILDVLKEKNVSAAFFVLINLLKKNPELIKKMENDGHLVCNHTAHHKDMSKIDDENAFYSELHSLELEYKELTGKEMERFYRPPEGKFSERNLQIGAQYGYKTIFWSLAYRDFDRNNQPGKEYVLEHFLPLVRITYHLYQVIFQHHPYLKLF